MSPHKQIKMCVANQSKAHPLRVVLCAVINQCLIVCGWNGDFFCSVLSRVELYGDYVERGRSLIMERNLEMESNLASAICSVYEISEVEMKTSSDPDRSGFTKQSKNRTKTKSDRT